MTNQPDNTRSAVVFDLDGTLADTALDICAALNAALTARNLDTLDAGAVRFMIGKGPRVLVERALLHLGVDPDQQLPESLTGAFMRCYAEQGNRRSTLFPGVRSCLERLAARQIRIGVCSNKPHEFCLALLADLGIARHFDAIQGSVDGTPKKPDPALLLKVLDRLGASPWHALYVGDSETDVRTARAAGVPVALVRHGYSAEPVGELGADEVLSSLQDLPRLCEALRSSDPQAVRPPRRSGAI